jgi:hypothetical protein
MTHLTDLALREVLYTYIESEVATVKSSISTVAKLSKSAEHRNLDFSFPV